MKALRFVLLAVGCVMIAVLSWRLLNPQWTPPRLVRPSLPVPSTVAVQHSAPTPAEARATVLSRLADAPTYAPFFDRLRTSFPSDYLGMVDQASQALVDTGHAPNPDRLMTDAMRRLRQSRGILAAKAEAGPLDNMIAAQAAMLDGLASENARLCVDFLYGGSSPEFMAFVATHRDVVERLGVADLEAIVSGSVSRLDRGEPESADIDGLERDLKGQGLSDDEIAAVLDGKIFDPPLPDARLCAAGRAYLRAIAAMPEDARLKVSALLATLLARS